MAAAKDTTLHARNLLQGDGLCRAREFAIEKDSVDAEKRTAVVAFSSEYPVKRTDFSGREFYEVLDHEQVDMSRITDGAALLFGHREHIGVVDAAAISPDKRGRAIIRFSRSKLGEEKMIDVRDKILTKTSVGYDLGNAEYVVQGEREGIPVYRFRNWQPYEVTLCPTGADPTVGLGRAKETPSQAQSAQGASTAERQAPAIRTIMSDTPSATTEKPVVTAVTDLAAERSRVKDINAAAKQLAERHPKHAESFRQLAAKCAETGDTIDTFNRTVLNDILATERTIAPVRQDANAASLGLSQKDIRKFSILRAARLMADNKPLDGLERECNDELTKKLDRQPKGFFVPDEILADRRSQRTLAAGVPADGGYTVATQDLPNELVTFLRSNSVVMGLGARLMSGLVGDVSIPRQLTGATVYWVSETGSITQSGATFGQIVARPRRIGTSVPYTKQFIAQTSLDAESFVVQDSDASIAVDLDRVALRGGGGVEPLGILNLASGDLSTAVSFSAAATWAKYLAFFQNVADSKALLNPAATGYVTSPASAVKAMTIPKFSNTATPIWDENDKIGAFKAAWSNNIATSGSGTLNQVIFGDWSQVYFMEWAGRDVVIDPYSGKKEGTVEITIQRLMDVIIRRAKSFAISSDSGAQ